MLKYALLFVFAIDAIKCIDIQDSLNVPEDGKLSCEELITKYGHNPEIHYVTTKDNYILKLYHIPGNKTRPLLLLHGVFDSSNGWIIRGSSSLGILAADADYDVWLINFRGNRHSRNHTILNPDKDMEFWDYSAHEYGKYDLPATIDFVLEATGQKQLSVVAFSEGTTSVFVLGSSHPEYNDKIKAFVALAPVAFLEHVQPFLSYIIGISPVLNFFLPHSVQEISGYYSSSKAFLNFLCTQLAISYELCYQGGLNSVSGPDPSGIERGFFPIILGHFPAGCSRKNLLHFAQISLKKRFSKYDYGAAKNLGVYNSSQPPEYDLSKVTVKTVLVNGEIDTVSTIEDVKNLAKVLPNVLEHKVIKGFNHLDQVWGKDAHEKLYGYVLDVLKQYN